MDALREVNEIMEYTREVARGRVTGEEGINKFGRFSSLGTSELTIWGGGPRYTNTPGFPAFGTAPIDGLSSTQAGDTSISIVIEGLDISGNFVSQSVLTNGTTNVGLVTALWRVFRLYVDDTTAPAGDIRITDGAAVIYGFILAGDNQSAMAFYTVPKGRKLDLNAFHSDANKDTGGVYQILSKLYFRDGKAGKVERIQSLTGSIRNGTTHIHHEFITPIVIDEFFDIYINSIGSTTGLDTSAGFEGVLWTP